ncbi:MAG: TerB N-terminal domain-containing protein, partial [Rikenellaceae bacterium]
MGLLLLLAMLVQWLISILGYIIAAAVIYWIAYWLITSIKESAAKGVDSPPMPHKTKRPDIIITSQQEIHKVVEEKSLNIPIEQTKANITASSQTDDVLTETIDIKPMNTLDYIDDNDYLEDYEFDGVPYWRHTYIYSAEPIRSANKYQQAFYRHLKAEFYKGRYIDVDDCNNYVFILMFDLIDDYKKHRDYELIKDQLKELGTAYPITKRYIDNSLTRAAAEVTCDSLKIYTTKPKQCHWISKGEVYDCSGAILTRGNFYVGDQFVYSDKNYQGRDVYVTIKSPVLTPNALINPDASQKSLFSSYTGMSQDDRELYLKWLSEEITVSDMPAELLCLYLYGLEIRMFADEDTTEEQRIDILREVLQLKDYVTDFTTLGYICGFIDNCLIKIHPTIPADIASSSQLLGCKEFNKYVESKILQHVRGGVLHGEDAYTIATITHGEDLRYIPERYHEAVKQWFVELFDKRNKGGIEFRIYDSESEYLYPMMSRQNRIFGRFCPQQVYIKMAVYKMPHIRLYTIDFAIDSVVRDIKFNFDTYLSSDNRSIAVLSLPDYVDISGGEEFVKFRESIENLTCGEDVKLVEFDDVLKCIDFVRKDDKNLNKGYLSIFDRAFQRIGYGITPNYEIDEKKLNFGIKCAIYRRYTDQTLKRGVAHERTNIFVRLAAMMFRGVEVTEQDSEYVRKYINANCKVAVNREHLYAYFVWLSAGKLGIDAKIKKGIAELLNSEQSSKLCNSLIELCCLGGNPAPKKISALQRILP